MPASRQFRIPREEPHDSTTATAPVGAPGVVIAAAVGLASYAFTAANTVPDTSAGDGNGAITGFTITNVQYALNAANPKALDSVEFDMAHDNGNTNVPSDVRVQLAAPAGAWYTCAVDSALHATCATAGESVLTADLLTVVAAD